MANKTIGQLNQYNNQIENTDNLIFFHPEQVGSTSGTTYKINVGQLPFGSGSGLNNIQDTENGGIQLSDGLSTASGNYAFALSTGAYAPGNNSFALGNSTASGSNSLAIGSKTYANGNFSFTCGSGTKASSRSVAEGDASEAGAAASHAEGKQTHTYASWSHAQGIGSETRAMGSHAEGASKVGTNSYVGHAEGFQTTASSTASHSEGRNTLAFGDAAHAEGSASTARGSFSHAEGQGTIANYRNQHVFGQFNDEDDAGGEIFTDLGEYIEIVGNGASTASTSNARTLDWDGNEWLAGNLTVASSHAVQPEFRHYRTSINANRQIGVPTEINNSYYLPSYNYFLPLCRTSNAFTPRAIPILNKGLVRISGNCNITPASTACFDSIATNTWQSGVDCLKTIGMSIFVSTASDLTTYNGSSSFPLIADEYEIKLPLIPQAYNSRIPFDFTIPTRLINTDTIYLYGFLNSSPWSNSSQSSSTTPSTASTNFSLTTGFTVENIYATELS